MLNKNELRAEIKRNGYTQEQVAKLIGINPKTFSTKINNDGFTTNEAYILIDTLHIMNPVSIFFAKCDT